VIVDPGYPAGHNPEVRSAPVSDTADLKEISNPSPSTDEFPVAPPASQNPVTEDGSASVDAEDHKVESDQAPSTDELPVAPPANQNPVIEDGSAPVDAKEHKVESDTDSLTDEHSPAPARTTGEHSPAQEPATGELSTSAPATSELGDNISKAPKTLAEHLDSVKENILMLKVSGEV